MMQSFVRRFQKKDINIQALFAQCFKLFGKVCQKGTLTDVNYQCGARDSVLILTDLNEAREGRQHRQWQVINTEVAQILKSIHRRRHSRSAKPGDNHDIGHYFQTRRLCFFPFHTVPQTVSLRRATHASTLTESEYLRSLPSKTKCPSRLESVDRFPQLSVVRRQTEVCRTWLVFQLEQLF